MKKILTGYVLPIIGICIGLAVMTSGGVGLMKLEQDHQLRVARILAGKEIIVEDEYRLVDAREEIQELTEKIKAQDLKIKELERKLSHLEFQFLNR